MKVLGPQRRRWYGIDEESIYRMQATKFYSEKFGVIASGETVETAFSKMQIEACCDEVEPYSSIWSAVQDNGGSLAVANWQGEVEEEFVAEGEYVEAEDVYDASSGSDYVEASVAEGQDDLDEEQYHVLHAKMMGYNELNR